MIFGFRRKNSDQKVSSSVSEIDSLLMRTSYIWRIRDVQVNDGLGTTREVLARKVLTRKVLTRKVQTRKVLTRKVPLKNVLLSESPKSPLNFRPIPT